MVPNVNKPLPETTKENKEVNFIENICYLHSWFFFILALHPGVYIKFEIHSFAFFLNFIFPPNEIYFNEVVRAAGDFFFCNFVNFNLGKKLHFPSFFILFQSFFSPNMLFGHIFGQQKNIHPGCMHKIFPQRDKMGCTHIPSYSLIHV